MTIPRREVANLRRKLAGSPFFWQPGRPAGLNQPRRGLAGGRSVRHGRAAQHLALVGVQRGQPAGVQEQHALAWFYWNYKTEGRGIWNFRSLVEDGFLELPPRK